MKYTFCYSRYVCRVYCSCVCVSECVRSRLAPGMWSAERLTSIKKIGVSKANITGQSFCISSNCGSWYVRQGYETVCMWPVDVCVYCSLFCEFGARSIYAHSQLDWNHTEHIEQVNNRTSRSRTQIHTHRRKRKRASTPRMFFFPFEGTIFVQCAENDLFRCLH